LSYQTALFFPVKLKKAVFFSGLPILVLSSETARQHGDGFVLWIPLSQFCSELGYNHLVVPRLMCSYRFGKISEWQPAMYFALKCW